MANPRGEAFDPKTIHTRAELAAALTKLRRTLTLRDLDRVSRSRGGPGLPPSTVSGMLKSGTCTVDTLTAYLNACGVQRADHPPWIDAWQRTRLIARHLPPGLLRVHESRPRLLGVKAAIDTEGASGDLPEYVPREVDVDGPRCVRVQLGEARSTGGFYLLVGDSSVGKTRTAYEAMTAVLGDWWLVMPPDASALAVMADELPAETVIWLDSLNNYFGGAEGLTASLIRSLLVPGSPRILLATLWTKYHAHYQAPPTMITDPLLHEREVVQLATSIHVPTDLTSMEMSRARLIAARDPRVRAAMRTTGGGLIQSIAAGPQLISRYQQASPWARSLLIAACDLVRHGVRAPMTAQLLGDAAPGYWTPAERLSNPPDWLSAALSEVTDPAGGPAPLAFVFHDAGEGYLLEDYLLQHLLPWRQGDPLPASAWRSLVRNLTDPQDQARVAERASDRFLFCYAEPLLRKAAGNGGTGAADRLNSLLRAQGRAEEGNHFLREQALAGDDEALDRLVLSARRSDAPAVVEILDALVLSGHPTAAEQRNELLEYAELVPRLVDLAAEGDHDAFIRLLRLRKSHRNGEAVAAAVHDLTDRGHPEAARFLAEMERRDDDEDEEIASLWKRDIVSDPKAADRITSLLRGRGRLPELVPVLRKGFAEGSSDAGFRLAALLLELHRNSEHIDTLAELAAQGETVTEWPLIDALEQAGRAGEAEVWLLKRAEADDQTALHRLLRGLHAQGRSAEAADIARRLGRGTEGRALLPAPADVEIMGIDELSVRAAQGDLDARFRLGRLLEREEPLSGLRELAARGDRRAQWRLVSQLERRGRAVEAIPVLRDLHKAGELRAGLRLAELLLERRQVDDALSVLKALSRTDDVEARQRLIATLASERRFPDLESLAEQGDDLARDRLAVLRDREAWEEGLRRAAFRGDAQAERQIVDLLESEQRAPELMSLVALGVNGAAEAFVRLLRRTNRKRDADNVIRFGFTPDGDIASEPVRWDE